MKKIIRYIHRGLLLKSTCYYKFSSSNTVQQYEYLYSNDDIQVENNNQDWKEIPRKELKNRDSDGKKPKIKASEIIHKQERIAVIKDQDNVYPTVDMNCLKCKSKKSYFWTMQTRSSDESETKFYKCVKC